MSWFFCGEVGNKTKLRNAATLGLNMKVKDCAVLLCDKHMLSQLYTGDMVAINAAYYCACLTRLSRKVDKVRCDTKESYTTQLI